MRLLLDTQALLIWLTEPERLKPSTRAMIEDPDNEVLLSAVTLWEIVIKQRIGKLKGSLATVLPPVNKAAFMRITVEEDHLYELEKLPLHHNDPFDRLLIAQAIAEAAQFVSGDRRVAAYPVKTIPC